MNTCIIVLDVLLLLGVSVQGQFNYTNCNTGICFGIPDGCLITSNCNAIAHVERLNSTSYEFEVQTLTVVDPQIVYVAVALSEDTRMEDDSVVECVNENNQVQVYMSYTHRSPTGATRHEFTDEITVMETSYNSGLIYCRFLRNSFTSVQNATYDLTKEMYHLLLAYGTSVTDTGISRHDERLASPEPLIVPNEMEIYAGCGTTSACLGIPQNCELTLNCRSIVKAARLSNDWYQFEMQTFPTDGFTDPAYVASALSDDAAMGDDSVIECAQQSGIITAYTSVTRRGPSGSDRHDSTGIIELVDSSFVDGSIYCKVNRRTITTIGERTFNLNENPYFLLLASGTSVTATSITNHGNQNRVPSNDPLVGLLPDIDENTNIDYDQCGVSQTCFGMPTGCVENRNCHTVVAVKPRGQFYRFELATTAASGYAAVALSSDALMGDDTVVECVHENGDINMYTSFTMTDRSGSTRHPSDGKVALMAGTFIDGTLFCITERDPQITVFDKEFDLDTQPYHILLAIGNDITPNSISEHTQRAASQTAVLLSDIAILGAAGVPILVQLHGAFMIVAWLGCCSIAIVLARYFKQTWLSTEFMGKDYWFMGHMSLMSINWLLTMSSFIMIFVHVGGWLQTDNPHPILGLITTILCFLQPIGAAFRPSPTAPYRFLFNIAHYFAGTAAYVMAVITIFFAVDLSAAELPKWFTDIMIGFVCFYGVSHLILSVVACVADRENRSVLLLAKSVVGPGKRIEVERKHHSAPYTKLRTALLGIFALCDIIFVIALVIVVAKSPFDSTSAA